MLVVSGHDKFASDVRKALNMGELQRDVEVWVRRHLERCKGC